MNLRLLPLQVAQKEAQARMQAEFDRQMKADLAFKAAYPKKEVPLKPYVYMTSTTPTNPCSEIRLSEWREHPRMGSVPPIQFNSPQDYTIHGYVDRDVQDNAERYRHLVAERRAQITREYTQRDVTMTADFQSMYAGMMPPPQSTPEEEEDMRTMMDSLMENL